MDSKLSTKLLPNLQQKQRLNSAMDAMDEHTDNTEGKHSDSEVGSGAGSSSEAEMRKLVKEQRLVVNKLAKKQRARDREALRAKIEGMKSELNSPVLAPAITPAPLNKNKDVAIVNENDNENDGDIATGFTSEHVQEVARDPKHLRRTFWTSDRASDRPSSSVEDGNEVKHDTGLRSSIIARSEKLVSSRADVVGLPSEFHDIRVQISPNNSRIVTNTTGSSDSLIIENVVVNLNKYDKTSSDVNLNKSMLQDSYRINAAHSIPHCDSDSEGPQVQRRSTRTTTGKVESCDSTARSVSSARSHYKPSKRGKTVQSGVMAKATDTVRYPQDWPHIALKPDRIGAAYSFHELDAKQFVTGELELVTRQHISEAEHDGRLALLKRVMSLSRVYDWSAILKLYAEVVSEIEQGLLTWSSNFEPTLTWALNQHGPSKTHSKGPTVRGPGGGKSSNKARPNFCKDFQSNSCSFSDEKHWGFVKGERVQVEHICATCLFKRKTTAAHSESSLECPCKNSN